MGTLHFTLLVLGVSQIDAGTAGVLIQLGVPLQQSLLSFSTKKSLEFGISPAYLSPPVPVFSGPALPSPVPALIIITVAAFAWACSNIIVKKIEDTHPVAVIGWTSLFACPQIALWSALTETGQIDAILTAPVAAWARVFTLSLHPR